MWSFSFIYCRFYQTYHRIHHLGVKLCCSDIKLCLGNPSGIHTSDMVIINKNRKQQICILSVLNFANDQILKYCTKFRE